MLGGCGKALEATGRGRLEDVTFMNPASRSCHFWRQPAGFAGYLRHKSMDWGSEPTTSTHKTLIHWSKLQGATVPYLPWFGHPQGQRSFARPIGSSHLCETAWLANATAAPARLKTVAPSAHTHRPNASEPCVPFHRHEPQATAGLRSFRKGRLFAFRDCATTPGW